MSIQVRLNDGRYEIFFNGELEGSKAATLENWLKLRALDPNAPLNYQYPGSKTPYEHQRKTTEFLVAHRRAFCCNAMRTGKTISTLWAADALLAVGAVRRVLVVCPKTVMTSVWARELYISFPRYQTVVLTGDRKQKQAQASDDSNTFIIVNPDSLPIIVNHLPSVDLVIVDEFTAFKTISSLRYKALREIVWRTDRRLWMLSGTPTPQSPVDAFGPIKLVNQDLKLTKTAWCDLTMRQVSRFRWEPRDTAPVTVAKYLQPMIRFCLEDCSDVPALVFDYAEVGLTGAQSEAIKKLLASAATELDGHKITAANAAAVISKALQVMGGGVYSKTEKGKTWHFIEAQPLFEYLEGFIAEADTPVILFSPFREVAEAVAKKLQIPCVTGDTKPRDRAMICREVNAGAHRALVAVPQTISHGVDLSSCRYVVWITPPYSCELYAQGNARGQSMQQKGACIITNIIQHPIAKRVFDMLHSRGSLQEVLLEILGRHSEYERDGGVICATAGQD